MIFSDDKIDARPLPAGKEEWGAEISSLFLAALDEAQKPDECWGDQTLAETSLGPRHQTEVTPPDIIVKSAIDAA